MDSAINLELRGAMFTWQSGIQALLCVSQSVGGRVAPQQQAPVRIWQLRFLYLSWGSFANGLGNGEAEWKCLESLLLAADPLFSWNSHKKANH